MKYVFGTLREIFEKNQWTTFLNLSTWLFLFYAVRIDIFCNILLFSNMSSIIVSAEQREPWVPSWYLTNIPLRFWFNSFQSHSTNRSTNAKEITFSLVWMCKKKQGLIREPTASKDVHFLRSWFYLSNFFFHFRKKKCFCLVSENWASKKAAMGTKQKVYFQLMVNRRIPYAVLIDRWIK